MLQITTLRDTRANKEKTYREIADYLRSDERHEVYYIVPEHMKFEMESQILEAMTLLKSEGTKKRQDNGMMRLQVFSFKRLAWYLLGQRRFQLADGVDEVGLTMILKKVLTQLEEELVIFRKESRLLGFQKELAHLFKEFEVGNVTSQSLGKMIEKLEHSKLSHQPLVQSQLSKLKEIQRIYQAYEEWMTGRYLKEDTLYRLLKEELMQKDLTNVRIVIEGFYRFHANEWAALDLLMQITDQVEVLLTLEGQKKGQDGRSGQDLFVVTQETYRTLIAKAKASHVKVAVDRSAGWSEDVQEGFRVLDQTLCQDWSTLTTSSSELADKEKSAVQAVVSLWACSSVYGEGEQVANQIYHEVSQGKLRYREIQILTRDMAGVRQHVLPYLRANEIPYFVDDSETMANHPLARFFQALFQIYKGNWKYEDVFDLLRTELLLPLEEGNFSLEELKTFREMVDRTENVVLKNGFEGRKWWKPGIIWNYLHVDDSGRVVANTFDQETQEIANRVKAFLSAALMPLFKNWATDQTVDQAVRYLYQFLKKNRVPQTLMTWAKDQAAHSSLELGRQHEQAWQCFVKTLEQYHDLFTEEKFVVEEFFSLLQVAFEKANFHIVPPTLDSVTIRGIDSQRSAPKRVTFAIGLTDNTLPKTYQKPSLLNEDERELLTQVMAEDEGLAMSNQALNHNEKFIAYKLFLSATDHLYLTYSYTPTQTKEAQISPYLAYLRQRFELDLEDHGDLLGKRAVYILGNWRSQRQAFVKLQGRIDGKEKAKLANLKESFLSVSREEALTAKILKTLGVKKEVKNFPPSLAQALYGPKLSVSVSSLELYNKDPFSYFLKYGLRLRERQLFTIDERLTGDYYHRVLQNYFEAIKKGGDFQTVFDKVTESVAKEDLYAVLRVKPSHNYQRKQLNETLSRMIQVLLQRDQLLGLENAANEKTFTKTYPWMANYPIPVYLRGVIDRLETMLYEEEGQEKHLIQVTDYKSGKREVDFGGIYQGIDLQLFTYLLVQLQSLPKNKGIPLGAFYQEIKSPLKEITSQADYDHLYARKVGENPDMLAEYRYKGYLLGSQELLNQVLKDPHKGPDIYPYQLTTGGEFTKRSSILTLKEFDTLLAYVEACLQRTVDHILAGDIPLNPMEKEPYLPSTTLYKSVAQFDLTEPGKHYVDKVKMDKTTFFDQLRKQTSEEEEGDTSVERKPNELTTNE